MKPSATKTETSAAEPRASATASHSALARYCDGETGLARNYPDLHEHVIALARAGLLYIVDEPINKDTEMHPLVRWQYRGGIPERDRRAFLFTRPIDSKGRRYAGAVLVAGLAGNRAIYRIGFGRELADVGAAWRQAIDAPVEPRETTNAPCQDVVIEGNALDQPGQGLDALPVPISTPGWDNGPYLSAGHFITKDPDSGVQNLGTYRAQIKAPRRLGMNASVDFLQGIHLHWQKYKARREPMPACVVVGCPPLVSYVSGYKVPDDVDEVAVAGALARGPINVVRAKTVDLLVPAESEFVIEGYISTEFLEPEGPFGESHGHVNPQEYNCYMDVTAITHRRHPIMTSIISQVTPSESSTIRRAAMEPELLRHLQDGMGVKGVRRVSMHEPLTAVLAVFVIQFERGSPSTEIWRGLHGAACRYRFGGRWIIAVDEDIDPDNCDAVFWAMAYRSQPQHDLKIVDRKEAGHGPRGPRDDGEIAAVLIDATLKGPSAPVALPKREFMENARGIWERLGLPPLEPETPWHGYDLGAWPEELERQARLAAASDYFSLGDQLAGMRRADVAMNTPVDFGPGPRD
jgi:4-hydroxy-3-polyprenylbenzoate decarboxylase